MATKPVAPETEIYTLEEIMAAGDMDPVFVPIPEWGTKGITLRPMTTGETNATLEAAQVGGKLNMAQYSVQLIAASLISPALSDEAAADLVARKSARAVQRIVKAVQDLNVISEEAKEALKAEFPAEA